MPAEATSESSALADAEPTADPVIGRTLFLLALPVLGEQMLSFLVGLCDMYFAKPFGKVATNAVGFGAYVDWMATVLLSMVGAGTTALVSRASGAGDQPGTRHFANQSLLLGAALGLLVAGAIWLAAPWLAAMQNYQGETAATAVRFLRIGCAGYLFQSLILVGGAALRGIGDMRTSLGVMSVVNAVNIVAAREFSQASGLGWGVDGIAWGTVLARACGCLLLLLLLARGHHGMRLCAEDWRWRPDTVRRILRIGVPAAADGMLMVVGHFTFLGIISRTGGASLGEATLAAHFIGVRVEAVSYLPALAWGQAAATMIGQSLGAGRPDRAYRVGHAALGQCLCVTLSIAGFFFLGADWVYESMSDDPLVQGIGVPAFRWLAWFQVPLTAGIIYVQALRGAGDTRWPMLFTLVGVFALRIPLAWLGGIHFDAGLLGAWCGMFADNTARALFVTIRYSRGRWTRTVV